MTKKKIYQKDQQSAEKFLASYGTSREKLTEKQWEIVVNHFRNKRNTRVAIPLFLLLSVFFIWLTIWSFQRTNNLIVQVVPDEVIYVSKAGTETPIAIKPESIKTYLESLKKHSTQITIGLIFAPFTFTMFICLSVFKKHKLKVIEAIIECKEESKVTNKENISSPH
jgi:hypothetical protein